MTQGHNVPSAATRVDWLALSADLEAVFVATRRISAVTRMLAAEQVRMRMSDEQRQVREAWTDANHLLAGAAAELEAAIGVIAAKASTLVGLAMDAEDQAT